jgi:hypothetical protein
VGYTDPDRFLAAVEMQEPPHLSLAVKFGARLFELADADHIVVHGQQLSRFQQRTLLFPFHALSPAAQISEQTVSSDKSNNNQVNGKGAACSRIPVRYDYRKGPFRLS